MTLQRQPCLLGRIDSGSRHRDNTMQRLGPLVGTIVLLSAFGCSDSSGCTRGNPLMPLCVNTVSQPLPRDSRLLFQISMFGGDVEIYTVNTDGTDLKRLTNRVRISITPSTK